MPTFKQKNVIKSYKLRLQEKLKTVTEETENATTFLNNCVAEFRNRVQHILEIKDEKCLSLYRKLIRDLESYSEKIFILQASLEEVTEDETDSSEDESSVNASKDSKQKQISSTEEIANSDNSTEQNANPQTYPKEILNSLQSLNLANSHKECTDINESLAENSNLPSYEEKNLCRYFGDSLKVNTSSPNVIEDDGETEDDFYSLHSDNNVLNINNASIDIPCQLYDNQSISASEYASNDYVSASQNSCYRSISSSIGDSLSFHKDPKSFHSFKTYSLETNQECSTETPEVPSTIRDQEFEISSTFAATLSHVIDPSDFWIQINKLSHELTFPRSDYGHLGSLSSIKKGECCLAPFKSTPFYFRAKSFSDANSGTDIVKVLFIDHGSSEDVPLCELRPLPKNAFCIPAQAIHCYLYGIASANDSWSDEAIERFKEFQNYFIETVVKSKEYTYGVQLIVKTPADNFTDDFCIDVAEALCLNGFAISLNVSDSCTDSPNIQCASSHASKPDYNKTDSSLEVSGSYDINAISSDSGVSVTSTYKASQICNKRNKILTKISRDFISPVPIKNTPILFDQNLNKLDHDMQMQNLISFESYNALDEIQTSNKEVNVLNKQTSQYCVKCDSDMFCLHHKIPSPTLLFVEKDMMIVMISHIVNPHEFYVNMAMENIMTLDDLREQMTQTFENDKNVPCVKISNLAENMYCAGRFEADNYWYRVKVLKIDTEDKGSNEILGQYVDYGNTAKIKCCDLRPLTQEFAKHPIFAIKCSLAGIRPIQDSSLSEKSEWSEDAIKVFKELTSDDRCLTAQICNELCKDDVYSVLLWDTDNSKDLLINASLADNKVAVFDSRLLQSPTSPSSKTFVNPSIDTWDPMLDEYLGSHNSYAVDDEDIEIVTTGYHAKDEQYTCKYFSMRGYCPRGSNCPYEHLPVLESGLTFDQEEVYCFDTTPITENVNNILVEISAVETPSLFYVVLPFGCKSVDDMDKMIFQGASESDIINSEAKALFYAVNEHYANSPFQENTAVALSIGTIVVAKCKWDERWHRGRVVDVADINKPAKIFFVDSGAQEWVPRKLIRTILPQFLHTPFQAVECSLYGIEPVGFENGSSWSVDAMNYFTDIVKGEVLLARIVERYGQSYQISLRKTTATDHKFIADHLVSAGYAQYHKVTKQKKSKVKNVIYVPG